MSEEWKGIIGFEGIYSISSYGRIKSEDRISASGKIIKGKMLAGNGKRSITASDKKGVKSTLYISTEVVKHFVNKPKTNKPLSLIFIDGNSKNIRASNRKYIVDLGQHREWRSKIEGIDEAVNWLELNHSDVFLEFNRIVSKGG